MNFSRLAGSAWFWLMMGAGIVAYGFSRLRGYHFYDEVEAQTEVVDWTPWEDLEKTGNWQKHVDLEMVSDGGAPDLGHAA